MKLEELHPLVKTGESESIEFKKSTAQLHTAFETISAFLNKRGGIVLIGVTDSGKIVGQDVSDRTKQEIARYISKIEPAAQSLINVEYIPVGNQKNVIIIKVKKGGYGPYSYDGRTFYRSETTTRIVTQIGYKQLLAEAGGLDYSWEEQPVNDFDIGMLDHKEIQRTVKAGVKSKRIPSDALEENIEEILTHRFDLILPNRKLKNAAVVLFAKKIPPVYSQCLIKMGRFKGDDDLGDFIDNQQFYGNAFQILAAADNFVTKHLSIASFFDENSYERTDKPTIPVLALREAFINAICHRDYSNRSGAIFLSIFNGRFELWNNGMLPRELKIDDLKKVHKSYPRNSIISKIFFIRGLVESWGKGTNRMIKICQNSGLPEPEFMEYSGGFGVNFRFRELLSTALSNHVNTEYRLSPRQTDILEIFDSKISMTFYEVVAQLKGAPAARTVRNDLIYLRKLKLITLKGFGRGARWVRLEKNKAIIRQQ